MIKLLAEQVNAPKALRDQMCLNMTIHIQMDCNLIENIWKDTSENLRSWKKKFRSSRWNCKETCRSSEASFSQEFLFTFVNLNEFECLKVFEKSY